MSKPRVWLLRILERFADAVRGKEAETFAGKTRRRVKKVYQLAYTVECDDGGEQQPPSVKLLSHVYQLAYTLEFPDGRRGDLQNMRVLAENGAQAQEVAAKHALGMNTGAVSVHFVGGPVLAAADVVGLAK